MKKKPLILFMSLCFLFHHTASLSSVKKTIYIGALYSQNGAFSQLGIPALKGAQLAIDDINTQGGISGHPVKLKVFNTQSSASVTAKLSQALSDMSNIDIITGLVDDNLLQAAMPSVVKNHKLFITAGATSGELAKQYANNLILACYTDAMQGKAAAKFTVNTLHAKKVLVIENTQMQYAINASDAFINELQGLTGQIVAKISFSPDTLDMEKLIAQLLPVKKQVEAIYFASGVPKTLDIIHQLRQNGFDEPIIGADGFDSDLLVKSTPSLRDVFFTTHAFLSLNGTPPSTQTFIKHYQNKYDTRPKNAFTALGYDATILAAEFLMHSKKVRSKEAKQQLIQLLYFLPPYTGASSEISFHGRNIPNKNIYMIQINKNKRQLASVLSI
ncbi:ABC transporter substrate-binding protein [uncultured Shewanella sp.]|uniref:ABC transporter substrate-binding protein n=1 Tax=uncultured Shewanella sp. TaxID=173975 RepID=UPI00261BEA1F|nr:ABC transporter substrate-binding protein [uncultured Shewanella sp.]